jgi:penicillin-binding protein 2
MISFFKKLSKKNIYKSRVKDIDPDEIFIDSENLPKFDVHQFEGRIERPISPRTFIFLGLAFVIILLAFFGRSWFLQINSGDEYLARSENNRLRNTLIFAKRGVVTDRNDKKLVWNIPNDNNPEFLLRKYEDLPGLSSVVGYLKYPSKDKFGFYYNDAFIGKDGIEKYFDSELSGENGLRIVEIDALGKIQSENVVRQPQDGKDLKLSIDSSVQNKLYESIADLAGRVGFSGGAGVIMDVNSGEVLALTSYPEYNSQVLTDGDNSGLINKYLNDKNKPFLDRVIDGLYTPGSIVKPFMATAALQEKVIDPLQNILSTGSISLPNPYDPAHPSVFKDWQPQGYVDMRHALAMSSDVYFYEVGGGYQDQKGLGISLIDKYMQMFGFGSALPDGFFKGVAGTIPDPEWKKENFNGEDWRIGDTYHTAIGQYGFQVSPIQIVRGIASLANGGKLIEPTIIHGQTTNDSNISLPLDPANLKVVREGMKLSSEIGTSKGLFYQDFSIGGKTGTAELGAKKQYVNSWVVGFFPYDNPKYAFAVIMEKGPVTNTMGGVYVMRQVFDWMRIYTPEYLK